MKDAVGQDINIGDVVAIIYHPEAYRFSIEPATILSITGTKNKITTKLLKSDATPAFMPDESGEVYRRLIKIAREFPFTDYEPVDAVGHIVHIGDTIACRLPTEAGGNTVKGFIKGGKVSKITPQNVFYVDEETGTTKRKAFNGIIVY